VSERRTQAWPVTLAAGLIVGAVESVLAVSFAALVFAGLLAGRLPEGVGLYLAAAAVTLGVLAWRAGSRGVVGGLQEVPAAVLAGVASSVALSAYGGPDRAYLTVVAATLVVGLLCGIAFLMLGTLRRGNLIRFVPVPVVGGLLAGIGWLLCRGGVAVAADLPPDLLTVGDLLTEPMAIRWGPAVAFGVVLLLATRLVRRPLVLPAVLLLGVVLFVVGAFVTGSSLEEAKAGSWLLGPFGSIEPWQPWTLEAVTGADWAAVLGQAVGIVVAVFVVTLAVLFNVNATELVLRHDLDTNRELRDVGILNLAAGSVGGIPGYHALSLTSLAAGMRAGARGVGFMAALVPLALVAFGARVVELIPRMLVGGVLVFLGLALLAEWVWDRRRSLSTVEYVVVLLILATIAWRGLFSGVVIGVVLAVVLFAISYGRIDQVREVAFGDTYRSNVDRPPSERGVLAAMGERVQILRLQGFVFFGTANGLLERIRRRLETGAPAFLVIDLVRVSGVDSSAVVSFVKIAGLAQTHGFELLFTGASGPVLRQLERGGVVPTDGVVSFEPDLDRGLERCEDTLLAGAPLAADSGDGAGGMPPGLERYLERLELTEGTVLIHQRDRAGDVFVVEAGRLAVEMTTAEGTRMRLRSIRPGVVVGEIAMYSGVPRTADVVAETPCVVLRLGSGALERIEADEPELAAGVHRWLARTLSDRLIDTVRAFDAMLD
jgi:SulP family sulfate permease